MNRQEKLSMKERMVAANAVDLLEVSGKYTTDDLGEWEVRPERIAEVQQTHSSCIPNAMSGWNKTVPLPTTWAIWWVSRMTHANHQSGCGMGGNN